MKRILLTLCCTACIAAVAAQSDYHNQKASLYETLGTSPRDIVLFGNSLTDGGEWVELLDNRHVRNRGINSDNTTGMLRRLDAILKGRPRKLFLLAGVNDLGAGRSPEQVVEGIRRILERIRQQSPRTAIHVESLLPCNDAFGRFKSYRDGALDEPIRDVNRRLRILCTELGVTFIDLYPHFVDGQGKLRSELTNDGLHLLGEGYRLWARLLKPYMK